MSYTPPKFTGSPETYKNHHDCSYHVRKCFDFDLLPPCNVFYYLATKSQKSSSSSFLDLVQNILDASLLGDLVKVKQLHADALANGWAIPLQLMATAATERGHATTVQYCLEKGADIDIDVDVASMRGPNPDLYAVLIKAGWPKAPRTINDVLRCDLRKGEPVVRFLLEHGAQIEPGTFALAATSCDVATLELLVSRGCQIHDSGALQTAASNNNLANVKWLLEKGARINEIPKYNPGDERDCNNGTALHRAVACTQVETVRYLLEQGADTQILDEQVLTPKQLAMKYLGKHKDEIIDLLDRFTTKL